MKIYLKPAGRKPLLHWSFYLLAFFWLAVVVSAVLIANHLNYSQSLCTFKRMTGIACPTCGMTRGSFALLRGHFLSAWKFNPFIFTAGFSLFFHFIFRMITGKSIMIKGGKLGWIILAICLAILFLVNWAYIIVYIK